MGPENGVARAMTRITIRVEVKMANRAGLRLLAGFVLVLAGLRSTSAQGVARPGEMALGVPVEGGAELLPAGSLTLARPDQQSGRESIAEWLLEPFLVVEDPDGPIGTDRPSFTAANTVVPRGRLQFESGYNFEHDLTDTTRTNGQDFPELATRYGLTDRLEFRTYWTGQVYHRTVDRRTGLAQTRNGSSDMEIGFKTQLWLQGEQSRFVPTTALITSVQTPVGGSSPNSSVVVQPYLDLLYGWEIGESWRLAASTGLQAMRDRQEGRAADSYEQYHQSIVAYFTATPRVTLFSEWFVLGYVNAAGRLPDHFVDGGILYQPLPNIQLDARAGYGLGDRPTDFFCGTGFSIRF